MKKFFLVLFFSTASIVSAKQFSDYTFEKERMRLASDGIYVISSFEDSDRVTAYSYNGDFLWDTSFSAKIISWKIAGNSIFIFSKHRSGYKTYLTCLDRYSGQAIWKDKICQKL